MATLMEKDVLLELVATGLGEISRAKQRKEITEELSDNDRFYLVDLRKKLYSSNEKEWDFLKTANDIKNVCQKYQIKD
ncbi:Uncharacterised protein [Campylobacter sputorum subsp. bubulus]|uniref:Uncharacterized protein n=1 Tax=Campylobacter sputorum subsp. sputorum TaxID=32024 RepID=A0A381DJH0_9BACT|nr:hypothetical protein [Campylobacter sputorum]ASM35781.1 hypothetical protein CSPUT_1611 [Campylobacter sputorum aubsp. sputorum RM3237]ASM37480.1 hypothetical protein CSF_1643 [Campylobacter sputorum bv. faecalis CCUG 20703]ASM39144.1 hypothetical protein CSPARA_1611 [Campylobacter sputorum bv. paraureolyticus LMG 11764]KAB0581485.1 hypothetical protein F7P64_06075 [Campylobacter sputorum subsp. sputorum]MDY6120470.1 hypothetical protein [Campylobacter sputorum]